MTAGNQGAAWDKAKAELKKDPKDKNLQAQEARARAALNESMARAGQSKRY